MSEQADSLAARLAPYRAAPGITAALLISADGFVIAADAEPGFHAEALAALVAGAIDMGARLAAELRQERAKYISLEFDDVNVVLAPFGDELMLAVVGDPATLICDYRLDARQA